MLMEIVSGSDDVKEIRDKNTQEIRGLQQECYFRLPDSAYPVRGKVRIDTRLQPGKYDITPAYRVGRFGDLEINPFAVPVIKPATPDQVKAAS